MGEGDRVRPVGEIARAGFGASGLFGSGFCTGIDEVDAACVTVTDGGVFSLETVEARETEEEEVEVGVLLFGGT